MVLAPDADRCEDTARPQAMEPSPQAPDIARTRLVHAMIGTACGDRAAFRDVYTLTSAKLFGICLRVCGERGGAEEVLHEVYLTVWNKAGSWRPSRCSPITWLSIIARNRSIDWRRRRKTGRMAPFDDALAVADPAPGPDNLAYATSETRLLHACLDRLEPRQAAAIRTAFFEGLSYAELARRDGVPLGTMKSWIRRGLAQLKQHMES